MYLYNIYIYIYTIYIYTLYNRALYKFTINSHDIFNFLLLAEQIWSNLKTRFQKNIIQKNMFYGQ